MAKKLTEADTFFNNFKGFVELYHYTHNNDKYNPIPKYVVYKNELLALGKNLLGLVQEYQDDRIPFLTKRGYYSGDFLFKHAEVLNCPDFTDLSSKHHLLLGGLYKITDKYDNKYKPFQNLDRSKFTCYLDKYSKSDIAKLSKAFAAYVYLDFDDNHHTFSDGSYLTLKQCNFLCNYYKPDFYFAYNMIKAIKDLHHSTNLFEHHKYLFRAIDAFSNRYKTEEPGYLSNLGVDFGYMLADDDTILRYQHKGIKIDRTYKVHSVYSTKDNKVHIDCHQITHKEIKDLLNLIMIQARHSGLFDISTGYTARVAKYISFY